MMSYPSYSVDNKNNNDPTNTSSIDAHLSSLRAEGLTSSALQQSISSLELRKDEVLADLLTKTKAACVGPTDDATALATEAAYATAVANLGSVPDLVDANHADAHSHLTEVYRIAEEHSQVATTLQETLQAMSQVGAIVEIQQGIASYDTMVSQGAFSAAARLILELEGSVERVVGAEGMIGPIKERISLFKDYVITAPPQYFTIDPKTHITTLISPAETTAPAMAQLWEAALTLDALPDALSQLSTSLVEHCIKPILRDDIKKHATASVMESPAGSIASSALSAATTVAGHHVAAAERTLYRAFKSICESCLQNQLDLIRQFGRVFWPATASAYISAKLKPAKPVTDLEIVGFMRLGSLAAKLEQKAVKLELWPENEEGPLAKFVRQTVGRTLADKRVRHATAARDLLTSSASKETITTTFPPTSSKASTPVTSSSASRALFQSENESTNVSAVSAAIAELANEPAIGDVGSYQISRSVHGLVSLMNEALRDACKSSSAALAQAMCGAVVDLASLLVALDSATHEQEREVPFIAAMRYNDCMHVYRHLLILPQQYAPRLQSLVHPAVNFVAPAKRVRAVGEAALHSMVARQQSELFDLARDLQRWRGLDGPGIIRSNKAARQLLASFQRFGSVLRDVLPCATFVNVSAELANAVCDVISDSILSMGDISEEESEQIPHIVGVLTHPESGILAQLGGHKGVDSAAHHDHSLDICKQKLYGAAIKVHKLREVCEMLCIPSREIALRWRSGRLSAVGLSKENAVDMVRALFEDNEYSRASVNAILTS